MATKGDSALVMAAAPAAASRVSASTTFARGPLRPQEMRSLRQRHDRRLGPHLFRTVDVAFTVAAMLITVDRAIARPLPDTTLAEIAPFAIGTMILLRLLRGLDLYSMGRSERLVTHLGRTLLAHAITFGAAFAAHSLIGGIPPSDQALIVWMTVSAVGLMALHATWWSFVRRWRVQGWLTPNIVIVGATAHAADLIRDAIARRDMHVLGIFDDRRERSPFALLGVPVLGDVAALVSHRITPFVDLVVVAVDPTATNRVREITAQLAVLPNPVTLLFDHDDQHSRSAVIAQLCNAPLAPLNRAVDDQRRAFAKRIQDLVIGSIALVLFSPIIALVAIAVRIDSPGPIFFRQRRHGFHNEEIVVWKFRSMRVEATDARAERQVTRNDDRVTRIGRILRKTSLDELPQLFNVLRGEMSLVGPRPHAIGMKSGDVESALLVAEYAHRHRIKPGMTGWAAIKGSRGALPEAADVSRRVELDVEYIDHQSFWRDLWIIALTIPCMLGDSDAIR